MMITYGKGEAMERRRWMDATCNAGTNNWRDDSTGRTERRIVHRNLMEGSDNK